MTICCALVVFRAQAQHGSDCVWQDPGRYGLCGPGSAVHRFHTVFALPTPHPGNTPMDNNLVDPGRATIF